MLLAMQDDDTPIVSGPSVVYRSYLLRLWRDEAADAPWRAMLESVTDPGERHHFAHMQRLLAFLHTACARPTGDGPDTS